MQAVSQRSPIYLIIIAAGGQNWRELSSAAKHYKCGGSWMFMINIFAYVNMETTSICSKNRGQQIEFPWPTLEDGFQRFASDLLLDIDKIVSTHRYALPRLRARATLILRSFKLVSKTRNSITTILVVAGSLICTKEGGCYLWCGSCSEKAGQGLMDLKLLD